MILARFVLVALTTVGCRATAAERPVAARLDRFLDRLHERGLFDGAVVVGVGDRVLWQRGVGYADLERRVPFTPDTPADAASIAKTFTSALVLELDGEGRLDLDAPVQRLLPELPYPDVSLRHLLSHSSGIPVLDYDYFDPFLAPGEVRTTERLLAVIRAERPPLLFEPGTGFEYSSFGFDLAALAAARAGGASYGQLLAARFFSPLGATSAFLRPARFDDFPGVRTRGYRREGGALVANEVFDLEAFHGGSNIYLSARDLQRWGASFLLRPRLGAGAFAAAHQPARISGAPSGLTLGSWYRDGAGSAFWYPGHLQGFHAVVFRDLRTRTTIAYVSNNTIEPWVQHAVIRAIRAILAGRAPEPLARPATAEIRPADRAMLPGRWVTSGGERLAIERSGEHLAFIQGGVSYRMVQIDPRAFYVPGLDNIVGLARDRSGGVARLHLSSMLAVRWARRGQARTPRVSESRRRGQARTPGVAEPHASGE